MTESTVNETARTSNRRELAKVSGGVFAALAGMGVLTSVRAQDSTPEAVGGRDLSGHYGITRTYVVAEGADLDTLIGIVEEYAAMIAESPGFDAYSILYNDETRVWTAVSLFDTAENAQASTDAAAAFVQEKELASYFDESTPVIVEGRVIINAGF